MKLRILLLATPFVAGCGGAITLSPTQTATPKPNFVVFDATAYIGQPDLTKFGMVTAVSISPFDLWDGDGVDESNPPNPHNPVLLPILQQANSSQATAYIDIENWPVSGVAPSVIAEDVQKYVTTIKSLQEIAPEAKIGFYGVAPIRDYWDVVNGGPGSPQYTAWQEENDVVAPIAKQADVLFPSIYTIDSDQNAWKTYAIAQIKEARRIAPGKPVYAFLYMRYTDETIGDYIPADYWRMELETMRQYADGVVIWGGWGPNGWEQWDGNAPWWIETQAFLKELGY